MHRPFAPFFQPKRLLASWLLAAASQAGAAAPPPAIPMAELTRACTHCHGAQGRASASGYLPRIAGKPQGYLYQQLLNFRDGRRQQPAMAHLLATLDDGYLQEMAGYFARLELPYPPPEPARGTVAEQARGQALVRQGDVSTGLPACSTCHGDRLTGVAPAVPGLLGLPRDYLVAQLGAWRTSHRRADAPDCMARIARRISAPDLAAVVSWLSAQPLPPDTRPAPQAPPAPPDCGFAAQRAASPEASLGAR